MFVDFLILVAMVLISKTFQYAVILPGKFAILQSNYITTLKTLRANYFVSFKVTYVSYTSEYNIIDFISKDGNRVFGLWFTSNAEPYISSTNNVSNFWIGFNSVGDKLINISHLYVDNLRYNCSLRINEKIVNSIIDNTSRTFEDVQVYVFNSQNKPDTGFITSINITSKGKDLGVLIRDIYLNIDNSMEIYTYSKLKESLKYPQYPDGYHFINEFDAPKNFDENYCQRVRGWFQVVYDGNYTFYISCDNFCDLYLSGGIDPGNKINIISQKSWVQYLHWDSQNQKSAEIFLKANSKYYIEALMCEGKILDSLSVAFKQTNGSSGFLKPISAEWFSQMRIDEYPYDSHDIMENEICISENGTYRICTCTNGYAYENQGLSCIGIIDCKVNCKYPNSTCENQSGRNKCFCPNGSLFNEALLDCEDIDECLVSCKHANSTCKNFNGTFECLCPHGFIFKELECQDIDECLVSCKYPNSTCLNLNGTFNCICPQGYFFNRTVLECQDFDECSVSCMHQNSTCRNLNGTFECHCPQGYYFNDTIKDCEDFDECSVSCLYQNSTCTNLNGTFKCICPQGYYFNDTIRECQDFDECSVSCKYTNSTCTNLNGTFECYCPRGYFFNNTILECQDVDEHLVSCKNVNSICTNLNGTFECSCPHGYFFNETDLECEDKSGTVWSSWSECSVTCGKGFRVRFPVDDNLHNHHDENDYRCEYCENVKCPVDGEWNDWGEFTLCSQTCGNGVKYRYRKCSYPNLHGLNCDGVDEDFQQECETKAICPVTAIWSDWSHWSLCSQPCGDGNQSRFQFCNNLPSQLNGFICKGIRQETKKCFSNECKRVALNMFVSFIDEEYIEQYSDISKEPSKLLRDKISGEIEKLFKKHGKNTPFQLSLHSIRKDTLSKTGN